MHRSGDRVAGLFGEAGRRFRGAVVERDHRLAGEDPGAQLVVAGFGGGPGGRVEPGAGLPAVGREGARKVRICLKVVVRKGCLVPLSIT